MNLRKTRSIEIPLTLDHFETADSFIEEWMSQNHIGNKARLETRLLFESQFYGLITLYDNKRIPIAVSVSEQRWG